MLLAFLVIPGEPRSGEGRGPRWRMRAKSTEKYDRALKLAQKQPTPSKVVYDLLVAADKDGEGRATYALATWYLFGSPFTKIDYRVAKCLSGLPKTELPMRLTTSQFPMRRGLESGSLFPVPLNTTCAQPSWATRNRTMKSDECIFMELAFSEIEDWPLHGCQRPKRLA